MILEKIKPYLKYVIVLIVLYLLYLIHKDLMNIQNTQINNTRLLLEQREKFNYKRVVNNQRHEQIRPSLFVHVEKPSKMKVPEPELDIEFEETEDEKEEVIIEEEKKENSGILI